MFHPTPPQQTFGQKERDSLGLLHGRGLARAHVVSQDVATVHKNLTQKQTKCPHLTKHAVTRALEHGGSEG